MRTQTNRSNAGFSLVELMVVVAIIGILATIAVPNFQRFQAKAKQSNAKVELSGIYTAEKAFFTEYQSYHYHLPGIGFLPDGFDSSGASVGNSVRYYGSSAGTTGGVWPPALGAAVPTGYSGAFMPTASLCTGAAPATGATTAQDSFTARAEGCPKSTAQNPKDVWTINENKILVNSTIGI